MEKRKRKTIVTAARFQHPKRSISSAKFVATVTARRVCHPRRQLDMNLAASIDAALEAGLSGAAIVCDEAVINASYGLRVFVWFTWFR
jgi:hypothetical protein